LTKIYFFHGAKPIGTYSDINNEIHKIKKGQARVNKGNPHILHVAPTKKLELLVAAIWLSLMQLTKFHH